MEWTERLAWLTALGSAGAAPPDAADCADMGTAFGLDASMLPADALDLADAAPPSGWERRLVRRFEL